MNLQHREFGWGAKAAVAITQPKHLRRAKTNERWVVPSTVIVLSPCLQSRWKGETALAEHRKIVREVGMSKLEYNIGGLVVEVELKLGFSPAMCRSQGWS